MNPLNLDLNSDYEKSQNILEPYTFETLLLELHCNEKVIDETAARKQFEEQLQSKIEEAREIFEANLNGIVNQAKKDREEPSDEPQDLPSEVKEIIFSEQIKEEQEASLYKACQRIQQKLEAIGYTCDYDLSGEISNVRPRE